MDAKRTEHALKSMKLTKLREMAKKYNNIVKIKNFSKMRKADLIAEMLKKDALKVIKDSDEVKRQLQIVPFEPEKIEDSLKEQEKKIREREQGESKKLKGKSRREVLEEEDKKEKKKQSDARKPRREEIKKRLGIEGGSKEEEDPEAKGVLGWDLSSIFKHIKDKGTVAKHFAFGSKIKRSILDKLIHVLHFVMTEEGRKTRDKKDFLDFVKEKYNLNYTKLRNDLIKKSGRAGVKFTKQEKEEMKKNSLK